MNKIIQLWSVGYSGSSIINLYLNNLKNVNGLGEIDRVYNNDDLCPCICQQHNNDYNRTCHFYDNLDHDHFYEGCFALYPEATTLIDSSKRAAFLIPMRQQYQPIIDVVLAKYPHELAESLISHNRINVDVAFRRWIAYYQVVFQEVKDRIAISYRDFCLAPDTTIDKIANFAGISAERKPEPWWSTTTHIIGGNTSAKSQINSHYKWDKLAEKYKGNYHQIFVDDQWRKSPSLLVEALVAYHKYREQLEPLLWELGFPSVEALMADLGNPWV